MVSTGRTHIFTKHKILRNFQSNFKNARWKHAISDGLLRSRPVPNPGCFSCSTFIPNQLEVASNHSSLQSLHYWTKGKLNSKLIDLKNLNFEKKLFTFNFVYFLKQKGSKEEPASNYVTDIYEVLTRTKTDTIIDDRSELTIGRRLVDAKKSGYPFVVIVGKRSIETQPLFEVNDMYNSTSENMSIDSLIDYFQKKCSDGDLRKTAVC